MKLPARILALGLDLIRGKEYPRFVLAETLARAIYPKYRFSEFGRLFLEDEEFLHWYREHVSKYNYHSLDRRYMLRELIKLTLQVEGETAECGTLEGASSYLICSAANRRQKEHHVFDSFEGLSEPTPVDGDWWEKGSLSVPEETVRHNLRMFEKVFFHKGWIPARFGDVEDKKFSFVHIDVDLYQPTLDSISFFYKRLSDGGILLLDDYGFSTCPGATRAADDFMSSRPEPIVKLTTGQAMVVKSATL